MIKLEFSDEFFEVERVLESRQENKDFWGTHPIWYVGRNIDTGEVKGLVSLYGDEYVQYSVHSSEVLLNIEEGQSIYGGNKPIVHIYRLNQGDGLW